LLTADSDDLLEVSDPFKVDLNVPRVVTCNGEPEKVPIVPVLIKSVDRGAPRDLARIYSNKSNIEDGVLEDESGLIGFITSGAFSLASGRGEAIGHVLESEARNGIGECYVRNVGNRRVMRATFIPLKV
jgi:glycine cleavage system aminomethyltransferase T